MAKSLEAGKLIVGAIAVSIDPTGTAATTLGIDTVLTAKNWLNGTPDVGKLARELDAQFHKDLRSPRFNKPDEATTLREDILADLAALDTPA